MEEASIEDFQKLDLRTAKIISVEDHPNAGKLYILKVDLGNETRQLVAGVKGHYKREDLINKNVVIIANLKPAILRGIESQGMLLVAEDAGKAVLITTDSNIAIGAKIR